MVVVELFGPGYDVRWMRDENTINDDYSRTKRFHFVFLLDGSVECHSLSLFHIQDRDEVFQCSVHPRTDLNSMRENFNHSDQCELKENI